ELLHQLTEGSLDELIHDMRPLPPRPAAEGEFLPPAPVPHIVIGREIANALNVSVGERIRVISPLLETTTPFGVALPKSQDFRVAGIFLSKMYELDSRYAYVPLTSARRFLELGAHDVSGLQVRVDDPDRSDTVGALAASVLSRGERKFAAVDWKAKNRTLFAALKLERVVAFVVLFLIVFVASFSIVNTLTMSVIERAKEIAILKAMGAPDVGVMKVFLVQGLVVGGVGTLLGAGVALAGAFALTRFRLPIPNDVYYIDTLPVHVGVWDIVAVVLAALVIVWDFAVWPALKGARLRPVEGLRD
ncbi:MAG: ABC transporter permease, partial [Deltaproteobacteria bacterium]|nr:ABC transporter permease [Deltaproteobacteria bacterium]